MKFMCKVFVFLNLIDRIRKRTEDTDVALHPGVFSGIDFHGNFCVNSWSGSSKDTKLKIGKG